MVVPPSQTGAAPAASAVDEKPPAYYNTSDEENKVANCQDALSLASLIFSILNVILLIVVFSSAASSSDAIEALNWGYVDDYSLPTGPSYQEWCALHFTDEQCKETIKISGYFGLRNAYLTFRAYSTDSGSFVLEPRTEIIRYGTQTDKTECKIPDGGACAECDESTGTAIAFAVFLFLFQLAVMLNQWFNLFASSGYRPAYVVAQLVSFVFAIIVVGTVENHCLDDIPMDVDNGAMVVLVAGICVFCALQIILQCFLFYAMRLYNSRSPVHPESLEQQRAKDSAASVPPTAPNDYGAWRVRTQVRTIPGSDPNAGPFGDAPRGGTQRVAPMMISTPATHHEARQLGLPAEVAGPTSDQTRSLD